MFRSSGVQRFAPLLAEAARPCRHAPGDRWFVDESYLKVAGRWRYLHRAVDQFGQVIDVLVSEQRDTEAARRFLTRALTHGPAPVEVTTDRAAAYLRVLDDLLPDALHLTEQYANNPIEALQHEVTHLERAEWIGGPSHRQSSSGLAEPSPLP
jgi:IS6 family transposase